ncbi:MAG TPA: DUF5996 family protein [Terriglobales bacterium]|nr:DUF5996 family protein [Terriglobales bacterium]
MNSAASLVWPELPLAAWQDTYDTLHMWTQIIGKLRLEFCTHFNHWWEVPLYVNAVGLTTSAVPYGDGIFDAEFDFIAHRLVFRASDGQRKEIALAPKSVAQFYSEVMETLHAMGIEAKIWHMPVEVPDPIPFDVDTKHTSYNPEFAQRFWRILTNCDTLFKRFRSSFLGKVSPVHFFWGSFDLAVTRFSGRRAPKRPGADSITRDAYSHEVSSVGFWPGGGAVKGAAFYSYTAPSPEGFSSARVQPKEAFWSKELGEFLLMYDDVRNAPSPEQAVLDFCQSTYEAGANLAKWDRKALEVPSSFHPAKQAS